MRPATRCSICGGTTFRRREVLWQRLIDEWQISPAEVDYIDRQQGERCGDCRANLRSVALASALLSVFRSEDTLSAFVDSPAAAGFKVLEVNTAGNLHATLERMPGHVFGAYPEMDMHALPFADGSFDVVVHSDTLEHVADPIHALAECRRVLRPGGALCFTAPVIIGRMSRSREGLAPSYHGNAEEKRGDWVVRTEFGADLWAFVMEAGFERIQLFSVGYPAGLAWAAYREGVS
ncbi:class I SAM-dependent methyltransferase [Azorhizobium doebereinerae]|uniref:class I SAM-dependent methyltransferase n=1 Tax=Azorhizobium doebereinerae TaxID=281091 RepID=UPI0003F83041|nr:class I SAM-dependent methyltransferase [Azorhizobium doebereinerae]